MSALHYGSDRSAATVDLPEEYQYLLGEDALGELGLLQVIGANPPVCLLLSMAAFGSSYAFSVF